MKKSILLLMLGISVMLFWGCGYFDEGNSAIEDKSAVVGNDISEEIQEEITILISGPKAPPTFPLLRMMDTNALGEYVKIDFKIWNSVEEMLAIATSSEYGFLAIPVNVSAKLYNKGVDIRLTNVDTWGVMYLSTTDPNCNEWEDLRGKKLYVPFKSAPPDIITQHFLAHYGLEIGKDIELAYGTPSEIAQMVKVGKVEYAVNLEPFVTASKGGDKEVRVIMDYMDEWKKLEGEEYSIPNAGIATNNTFLNENPEIVEKFEIEYKKALEWTLENPEEASKLVEEYLGLNASLIQKAMPTLGLDYKLSSEARSDLERYYETLLEFKPESIGGKTPDEDYYYKGE